MRGTIHQNVVDQQLSHLQNNDGRFIAINQLIDYLHKINDY